MTSTPARKSRHPCCWRPTSPTPSRAQDAWRGVVAGAAQSGVPTPGFAAALSYYDGLRSERLPAALIQGQRDFFGAHTYKRVDKDGTYHTLWSGDRTETRTD
jgi:6-phosphogluconate dehydrogenase